MFGISFSELFLVGLIALLVLGPERLPGAARTVGLWVGRLKRSFNAIKQEVEHEIGDDEIRRQLYNEYILSLEQGVRKILSPVQELAKPAELVVEHSLAPALAADARFPAPAPKKPGPPPVALPASPDHTLFAASSMSPYKPKNDQHMLLALHLTELRTRLLRCVAAIFVTFAGLFAFTQQIYAFVSTPLRQYLPVGATMIATDVSSPFLTPLKLTMIISLFMAIPVILHQIWGFIAPGLHKHEKRIAVPLLVSSILLFYSGMAFAYFLVFPLTFKFFATATPAGVEMMTDITSYFDFVMTLFFAFGVAFEIPVAVVLLVWIGVVDVKYLKRVRSYVIIGCFVAGMILTPPDIFSQTLLAAPMWMLFEIGILFSSLISKRSEHPDDQLTDDDQPSATQL